MVRPSTRRRTPRSRRAARVALPLLAIVAFAAAAGCGRKPANEFVVGFSQMESDNPWRIAETKSLRDEAARRGVELVVTDAQGQTAKAANIPVILVDRAAAGTPGEDYVTLLASNFVEQGQRAADWLATATDGKAKIVELSGTPGSSVAIDRAKGFRDGIARYPGMTIFASQTGDFSRAKGEQVMRNLAQSLGAQVTAVYAHNDEMALGAIQALEAAGRQPGKDVVVVSSVDGERAGLEAIQNGECCPCVRRQGAVVAGRVCGVDVGVPLVPTVGQPFV